MRRYCRIGAVVNGHERGKGTFESAPSAGRPQALPVLVTRFEVRVVGGDDVRARARAACEIFAWRTRAHCRGRGQFV
ncbi:MAG TPA: hypothetical protein VF316_07060 [Polyangiaceae bacterium]